MSDEAKKLLDELLAMSGEDVREIANQLLTYSLYRNGEFYETWSPNERDQLTEFLRRDVELNGIGNIAKYWIGVHLEGDTESLPLGAIPAAHWCLWQWEGKFPPEES